MTKERELLERAYYVLSGLSYAILKDSGDYNLVDDIYEYRAEQTQDKPVDVSANLYRAVQEEDLKKNGFPAPHPFIRMTREEIGKLADSVLSLDWTDEFELYHFARDIEDALEEKNK